MSPECELDNVRAGLVYIRPKLVGFVRSHGPYAQSSAHAWRGMAAWLDRHDLRRQIAVSYGLCLDPPDTVNAQDCRYDACVEVPPDYQAIKSDGIAFQMLPGGAFARMRHVGPYTTVRSTIARVRDEWLVAQTRLLLDRRRPLLVIFLDDPDVRAAQTLRCDVCVPVRTHHEEALPRAKFSDTASLAN